MTLTVTIKLDNAAFGDCNGTEAARILTHAAERLQHDDLEDGFSLPLYDLNGNKVGSVEVSK